MAQNGGAVGRNGLSGQTSGGGNNGPQKLDPSCDTPFFRTVLNNSKVESQIAAAIQQGLHTENWGGSPPSETAFWYGYSVFGNARVSSIYSDDEERNVTAYSYKAMFAGIFFQKTFLHFHPDNIPLDDYDTAMADNYMLGTGINIIAFNRSGHATCHAPSK
jgi:hypothetical protein